MTKTMDEWFTTLDHYLVPFAMTVVFVSLCFATWTLYRHPHVVTLREWIAVVALWVMVIINFMFVLWFRAYTR